MKQVYVLTQEEIKRLVDFVLVLQAIDKKNKEKNSREV